uniref:Sema domain-containing protein n=2 Tax=Parascaris univalens TaxID=6257 RepID=A0A915ADH7_PARUN
MRHTQPTSSPAPLRRRPSLRDVDVLLKTTTLMLLVTFAQARFATDDIVAEFVNPNNINEDMPFEKMVIDPSTGRLYVGGVNNLYDLHASGLGVKAHAVTGPEEDSHDCLNRESCNRKTPHNSYTKGLAVYEKGSKLIECSSLFQGRCRWRNLYNIDQKDVIRESQRNVVANDRFSSTVIFVGAGPPNDDGIPRDVLYVASTYAQNGSYWDDVPAVASLSLAQETLFDVSVQGVGTGTEIKMERQFRGQYKIEYVGGFQSGRFAYFATRQPKGYIPGGNTFPIISKLVRVCTTDAHFWSYTEVPLECARGNETYNLLTDVYLSKPGYDLASSLGMSVEDDILYAVFVEGTGVDRSIPTTHSALCVYPMAAVEKIFLDNIEICFRGENDKNLPWFKSAERCQQTKFSGQEVLCGKDVNSYIGGDIAIEARPVLTTKDARFSAIATNTTRANTVAFIGTYDGRLLKAVIENRTAGFLYRTLEIGGGKPVLQDLELDGTGDHVYVLTPSSVSKVKVRHCGGAGDCESCLSQRDPYCGWCVLNNGCVPEGECTKSIPSTPHDWLTFRTGKCPLIRSVEPDKMQITSASYLNIELENLPSLGSQLTCIFDFGNASGPVTMLAEPSGATESRVRCPTPSLTRLPKIPTDSQSLAARLAIAGSVDGPPLAFTNFTFYDCSRFMSCGACVSSAFPCDWCIESDQCVAGTTTENRCRAQHIVNGLARIGPSRRKGPSHCPHMVADELEFYVASGKTRQISVRAKNLLDFMTDFKCQLRIEHSVHERLARKQGDVITCEVMKFDYYGPGMGNGMAIANFSIVWSTDGQQGGHVLDNSEGIRVVIYKCEMLASSCGLCLALSDKKFECGWCSSERQCTRPDKCPIESADDWLNRTQLCPYPIITDFNPKKGPLAGRTLLTIDGVNLGRSYQDVAGAVTAANVRCDVDQDLYVTASRIVCRTRPSPVQKTARNPIIVKLRDEHKYTAISNDSFMYVDPLVTRVEPLKGTKYGGTDVTIWGENMDAGSMVNVSINVASNRIPCQILERATDRLVCRTGPSFNDSDGSFSVAIDGSTQIYDNFRFKYEKAPTVSQVRFERSIASGGILVDVFGTGFKLLQRPYMLVMDEDRAIRGPRCIIERDDLMHCYTPDLMIPNDRHNHPTIEHPLMLEYGFEMDGVRPGNVSQLSGFNRLEVFPDPIVERFIDGRSYRSGDYLTINGKYLDAAASERDVLVTVGGETCNLTALANRALTCVPPDFPPEGYYNRKPNVVVKIGGMSYDVGQLSYNSKDSGVSPQVLVAILIAVLTVICAFILLLVFYRRKSTSHMREMKHLRNQIDQIEMKVATECKEAFAELQTSMNAMAAELPLGVSFIPFLSYKEYTARVLFPNNYHNHAVLRDLEVDSQRALSIETGLRAFNKLLMNKHFLLSFVRAMENNKYFLGKDRVTVGSLLMVVLMEKMEYCTEILKQLLKELIDRTVEKKFQPKILFRRSESVAERMLAAWYTFLMHRYLTERAGQKLYELYWAIKQQVEKGPQDALTLDARYSLSEEKLLRSSFDFREMMVFIAADNYSAGVTEYPVRVLDCDTITQVKEKCLDAKYRTTPFSDRPSANDLDLELRSACPRIILQDIDSTSKIEPGGWKRINTLAHYKVLNNATLALLPRQASLYNLSLLSERSERSTFSLTKQSPTLARPFGTNSSSQSKGLLSNMESNYKLYHLVKPSEHGPSDHQDKMVTEIYLTRLLTMKGTLQKFIKDLLEVIFSTSSHNCSFPPCIKYMFDFMDDQAREHGIEDDEVVHAWKSNSLPLRFWVNLIKNPHFVFDIPKPTKVEGCLSVVAQTLMDACSTQDHQLTKDSPSSKLLFAKDIYMYREWVDNYYGEIRSMPLISDQDMNAMLAEDSRSHSRDRFHVFSALNELYKYLEQYKDPLREELEMNQFAVNQKLPQKFQEMLNTMECMSDQYSNGGTSTLAAGYVNTYRRPREDRV